MVNLYASGKSDISYGRISIILRHEKVFSLNFKQLICLIEKFRLSLRFYIDNFF